MCCNGEDLHFVSETIRKLFNDVINQCIIALYVYIYLCLLFKTQKEAQILTLGWFLGWFWYKAEYVLTCLFASFVLLIRLMLSHISPNDTRGPEAYSVVCLFARYFTRGANSENKPKLRFCSCSMTSANMLLGDDMRESGVKVIIRTIQNSYSSSRAYLVLKENKKAIMELVCFVQCFNIHWILRGSNIVWELWLWIKQKW